MVSFLFFTHVAFSLVSCVTVSHSVESDLSTPWTIAHQAPLPMGLPRKEYWSGLPFPYPGGLANSGTEPFSPALQEDSLPFELQQTQQQSPFTSFPCIRFFVVFLLSDCAALGILVP